MNESITTQTTSEVVDTTGAPTLEVPARLGAGMRYGRILTASASAAVGGGQFGALGDVK